MGLREAVAAAGTGEVGTRFLRPDGTAYAAIGVSGSQDHDGPTAELEILRGQLSRLLLEAGRGRVEVRYGDHVVRAGQDERGVDVVTAAGRRERYDLLVIAEGKRSATRYLVFPGEAGYRDLGQYVAYGTIERSDTDDDWWQWLTATGSRVASLRPDNTGTTRATLAFLAPPMGINRLGTAAQIEVLRERFAGLGWHTPRILDGFAARPDDFYFERIEKVTMPRWTHGRVALLGDAAWAGPTGMGTSLALLGAYVLAGELARAPLDTPGALRAYERLLRPHVEKTQRIPPGLPGIALPKTRWGLKVLQGAHRLVATRPLRAALSSAAAPFDLPEYPQLRAEAQPEVRQGQ